MPKERRMPKNGRPRRAAPDDLVETPVIAELLHRTPNAIYVMRARAQRGEGSAPPAYQIGRRLLFSRSEVLAWIAEHASEPQPVA